MSTFIELGFPKSVSLPESGRKLVDSSLFPQAFAKMFSCYFITSFTATLGKEQQLILLKKKLTYCVLSD